MFLTMVSSDEESASNTKASLERDKRALLQSINTAKKTVLELLD